jgi:MinD superfamily P-loop ATPase
MDGHTMNVPNTRGYTQEDESDEDEVRYGPYHVSTKRCRKCHNDYGFDQVKWMHEPSVERNPFFCPWCIKTHFKSLEDIVDDKHSGKLFSEWSITLSKGFKMTVAAMQKARESERLYQTATTVITEFAHKANQHDDEIKQLKEEVARLKRDNALQRYLREAFERQLERASTVIQHLEPQDEY